MRYPRGEGTGVAMDAKLSTMEVGKAQLVRQGIGIAILNFGVLLDQALAAAEMLNATVVDMRWVKPLDETIILSLVEQHHALITLEENAIAGGAGSGVAEFLANADIRAVSTSASPTPSSPMGVRQCRQMAGLTAEAIVAAAADLNSTTQPASHTQQATNREPSGNRITCRNQQSCLRSEHHTADE